MIVFLPEKCEACRFSCKKEEGCKKFYPKECSLGYSIHFKEDFTKHYGKHESDLPL